MFRVMTTFMLTSVYICIYCALYMLCGHKSGCNFVLRLQDIIFPAMPIRKGALNSRACSIWTNRKENPNPNPKTCEIAKLYGPNVHFCDRNSARRIRLWIFHKFHKRVNINIRRFVCFNILLFFNVLV